MNDEINVVETEEQTNDIQEPIDEQVDKSEQEIEPQTEQQEEKPFSVDELDFESAYKVGNYDLSKYKDILPSENLQMLEEYARKYEEKGFTQEQIEYLIDNELEDRKPNRESIEKDLNKYLTVEEKRNYRTVGQQLKTALENDGLGKYYEEAMSNPIVFKIINSVMKTRGANIGARTERETRAVKQLTGYEAVEEFNKYLRANLGNADIQGKQKELLARLSEKEKQYFKDTLGI